MREGREARPEGRIFNDIYEIYRELIWEGRIQRILTMLDSDRSWPEMPWCPHITGRNYFSGKLCLYPCVICTPWCASGVCVCIRSSWYAVYGVCMGACVHACGLILLYVSWYLSNTSILCERYQLIALQGACESAAFYQLCHKSNLRFADSK
jgi:hypothetical protein